MRISVADQVYVEEVEGELVLLELDSGRYFGMDVVASHLWGLLVKLGSTEAVAQLAVEYYDVSLEQVTHDIDVLVRELAQRNLIVVEPNAVSTPG